MNDKKTLNAAILTGLRNIYIVHASSVFYLKGVCRKGVIVEDRGALGEGRWGKAWNNMRRRCRYHIAEGQYKILLLATTGDNDSTIGV